MIADVERIASDFLRDRLNLRVVGKPPPDTTTSWVRVVQLDALPEPASRVEHLISYLMQLDCYAGKDGGQPEANTLGMRVRDCLQSLPGARNGAVVTAVRTTGDVRLADETFEPARERRVLTMEIWAHLQ